MMMMNMVEGSSLGDMLVKVGLFVFVQALVYLILSKSSNVFSTTKRNSGNMKSTSSFRTARSVSIRRILAALSDMPAGEPSPSYKDLRSPVQDNSPRTMNASS
ncbi:hypothetical protein HS088_TW14G00534 [Tripterygium wilfordii]|uniref:Uncharacterized protein n=1 Tax=Tripterygium wilfordii TaxID=458696 RepID=A0A7J7CQL0_TRIWF|nr:hypothetical protein HS088_TW14G00534 [Tripterygium wilfordii]